MESMYPLTGAMLAFLPACHIYVEHLVRGTSPGLISMGGGGGIAPICSQKQEHSRTEYVVARAGSVGLHAVLTVEMNNVRFRESPVDIFGSESDGSIA